MSIRSVSPEHRRGLTPAHEVCFLQYFPRWAARRRRHDHQRVMKGCMPGPRHESSRCAWSSSCTWRRYLHHSVGLFFSRHHGPRSQTLAAESFSIPTPRLAERKTYRGLPPALRGTKSTYERHSK